LNADAIDEGRPKLGRASTLRIEIGRLGVALRTARGLFNERVEAGQPPTLAEVAYGGHVGVGVAAEEFYDVRTRLRASGVELKRNQVWKRHDSQAASGTDDRLGRCESAFDNLRKPATVVHDLDEAEWASRGDGRNAANLAAIPSAALTRSSTVIRRIRSISACREAA
jgi:hypothetical protein